MELGLFSVILSERTRGNWAQVEIQEIQFKEFLFV